MARTCLYYISCAILLLVGFLRDGHPFYCHALLGDPDTLINSFRGSSMILPLVLSSANSSRQFFKGTYRRQLQKKDRHTFDARMRLYDDLLTNGYYTTRLWIGTPPQEFALIVDSGSTVTYVPCSTCESCGKHQDPSFQPDLSSSYHPVKCSLDCTCDEEKRQCIYERQYAEMSSSSGVLGEDIVSFGKESALVPQRAVFGCENTETGDLYSQRADGIMGLGRGQLSIIDQLVEKHVISDSFSLCYGGMDVGGGAMVLGAISPPPDMVFSYSDPVRSPYYNIELKEIHIAGKPLPLNPRVFNGKHGTVLDSGTTYAYLPEPAFIAFRDAIVKQLHSHRQIPGPDPSYKDICFSGAGSDVSQLSRTFPEVDMVFGNGQKLSLSPENYLFRHSKVHGAYCLGIFQNGKDPTTLLGGIVVRNTLVTYDRERQKIGFWKTNCSELWERLQFARVPAQAPSPSYGSNSSFQSHSPILPPAPALHPFSVQFQVGRMEFEMSLSMKFADLVPHIPELAEGIANGLEVNTYQVHILNFTSQGNSSFVRWAIFPAASTDSISNNTAQVILSRLTDHLLLLPDSFGNYQLIYWKVEPILTRRTWWQRHWLQVTVGGIIMAVMVTLSSFMVWYFWRRHRQAVLGSYKPVDAALPDKEQELQLL